MTFLSRTIKENGVPFGLPIFSLLNYNLLTHYNIFYFGTCNLFISGYNVFMDIWSDILKNMAREQAIIDMESVGMIKQIPWYKKNTYMDRASLSMCSINIDLPVEHIRGKKIRPHPRCP